MLYNTIWSRLCGSMSPQKLFCCYRFTYSRTSRTKLGDAWYVSNVSIISDVPCWYYANYTCFPYVFTRFLTFYGTNLLTRCQVPVSCFLLFLVSEKLFWKYSRNWTLRRQKSLFFPEVPGVRRGVEDGHEGGHTMPRRGPPLAAPRQGVGPLAAHRHCPSAYLFRFSGKP